MSPDAPLNADAHEAAWGHALFDTALGPCGIAWGPGGIAAVQLPEADAPATQARLLRGLGRGTYPQVLPPAAPPAEVRHAIAGIQGLLAGQALDLREVPLDMSGVSAFHQQVYAIARAIPPGQTRTYGEVAEQLGGRAGAGPEPVCARRALPPGAGGGRQAWRLFSRGRCADQDAHAADRRGLPGRYAFAVWQRGLAQQTCPATRQ